VEHVPILDVRKKDTPKFKALSRKKGLKSRTLNDVTPGLAAQRGRGEQAFAPAPRIFSKNSPDFTLGARHSRFDPGREVASYAFLVI
jgi:hypothetical protein